MAFLCQTLVLKQSHVFIQDSCWAFATMGAIEGLHKIQTRNLVSPSSQEVYDCSDKKFVHSYNKALDWVTHNGGVISEAEHPCTCMQKQECKREKLDKISVSIRGYMERINSEKDLVMAVARQALITAKPLHGQ
uniref:Peptidase C1A papain C-terminal domain-containing protein n=1 Tax=Leersia perrieri TaxID=77586 RepID=A0A0D9V932_9ORYZ